MADEESLYDYYFNWPKEKLDEHRRAILMEQERQANLEQIPEQIAQLRKTYISGGGNPEDLESE